MTNRRRRTAVVSLLTAVVLALASLLLSAGAASASTSAEPLRARFDNLVPGSTAATSWSLWLDRAAVVAEVTIVQSGPGEVDWDVWLRHRDTGTTTPVAPGVTGAQLPAGAYDLHISVAVTDIPPSATNALEGRIVFAAATDGATGTGQDARTGAAADTAGKPHGALAYTGATGLSLLLAALATALVGLVLLLGARRRREDEAPPCTTAPTTADRRRAP
ncbi:LPXTG cell wall anchor domain-containing protein [Cellulomonas sp.]|uniref:LPXTG cell wall anchor domain-containing protein n=1 Tax=Cellulomonas sp. TaxID=40001 RepID=UPI00281128BC|nr:LPXTG cell wall anchor domain-containing protein [Cellulomonas sp.]